MEDAVNDVFQVPLRLFSRELCFQNNNKIISNGKKINPDHLPSNRGGATDIYIDYLDGHSIKLLSTEIGEKDCQTINKERLIGATITANFTLLGLIPLSSGEGSIFVKLDTNDSHLYVHLTHLSQLLLFVFSLLGISGLVLFLYSVVRFICEE